MTTELPENFADDYANALLDLTSNTDDPMKARESHKANSSDFIYGIQPKRRIEIEADDYGFWKNVDLTDFLLREANKLSEEGHAEENISLIFSETYNNGVYTPGEKLLLEEIVVGYFEDMLYTTHNIKYIIVKDQSRFHSRST